MTEIFTHLNELISRLPKDRQREAMAMLSEGTLVVDVRNAILNSGMTHYAIGKAAGVAVAGIDRFMRDERDMQLSTASKICEVLGYGLVKLAPKAETPAKKKAVKKKKPPG